MTTFAVLATGPSMSQAVAESVRHLRRIAVSDAFRLVPDADALVATDKRWWDAHPESLRFAGRRFSPSPYIRGVEQLKAETLNRTTNSGLVGLHVAIHVFGAKRVELYGFDMTAERGAHYFGPHVAKLPDGTGLANTKPPRFEVLKQQFAAYPVPKGVEIINCTKDSALLCFPFAEMATT